MTYSNDRLDRIEALLASVSENLSRTEKIVESNARVIESWGDRNEKKVQVDTEEVTTSTRADLDTHNQGIDPVRFNQLHEEQSQRFKDLLEEAKADRQRFDQLHEEHNQRFNILLEEAKADRQRADRDRALNESEHRTSRETFQTMLAVIARLWHRETD